jgi:hypothetical protein
MKRGAAVIFAIAAAMVFPQAAMSAEFLALNYPLVVDESTSGFVVPQTPIEVPTGFVKFSTLVPKAAKGRHGIGLDGGEYNNIRGATVKPGRQSSLTIELHPGDYTVFDSYKGNRAKGYAVRVHVTTTPAKQVSYGSTCRYRDEPAYYYTALWVKNVRCKSAHKLIDSVLRTWEDKNDFAYTPIVRGKFTCFITPFSSVGLKFSCLAGGARVTFAG